jgi:hypothetical protein
MLSGWQGVGPGERFVPQLVDINLHFIKLFDTTFVTVYYFSISIETSQSSRQAFRNCWDFLDCQDLLFASVKIKSLDQDHVETNQDPQA